jgi:hypothetical protein
MPVALVDATPFKHQMSQAELGRALTDVKAARARTADLKKQLLKSLNDGDIEAQRCAIHDLLHRPEPKICSAIAANRRLPRSRRRTLDWCMSIDQKVDVEQSIDEPVRVWGEPKKSGGVRPICDFGPMHRTAQHMVLRVMGPCYRPRPFQFTHNGVQPAIAAVRAHAADGLFYAAKLDIRNCFASFDPEKLATELPLPTRTVEYVVSGRHMRAEVDQDHANGYPYHAPPFPHYHASLAELARRGIPHGSVSSPIVAADAISRLNWTPSGRAELSNFVDDFLPVAASANKLREQIGRLTDAVKELPGGQFELRVLCEGHLGRGVDFLGHHLKLEGGTLRVSVSESNLQDFLGRLTQLETSLGPAAYLVGQHDRQRVIELLARFYAFADGWCRNFRECDNIGEWRAMWRWDFDRHLRELGISEEEIRAAVDESMTYEPSGYALDG